MTTRSFILPATLAVALGWSGQAGAGLVSQDLFAAGDGLVTLDTATGLQWLDVTANLNRSLQDVLATTFVQDEGFRLATVPELDQLFSNAGLVNGSQESQDIAAVRALTALLGSVTVIGGARCSGTTYQWEGTCGFVSNPSNPSDLGTLGGVYLNLLFEPPFTEFGGQRGSLGVDDVAYADIGVFLVRTAPTVVPLPAPVWLLGAGFLAYLGHGRFSRRDDETVSA